MRVVPPQDMVTYLECLGALEQRARVAAVAPISPVPHRSIPTARLSPSRHGPLRRTAWTEFLRWIRSLAERVAAACRNWVRTLSLLTVLLVVVGTTSLSAAQAPEDRAGVATRTARTPAHPGSRSVIDAEPVRLWALERQLDPLERDRVSRPPMVIMIREPDWRLLVALIVSYGALGSLSLVMFMRSRIGGRVGAAVAAVPRRVIRRLCRKPTHISEVRTESSAATMTGPTTANEPPVYRSTHSDEDPSDPLINCWLERLDTSLRLKGARSLPDQVWSTDLRSHRGNVRSRNEDFALGFRFHAHDVVVLADGCGGVPCGFQASRIAACAAVVNLVNHLPVTNSDAAACEDALSRAFVFASAKLADASSIYAPPGNEQPLLQTTLLIAVASATRLTMGYIGDGGAVVVRPEDGTEERLLQPMKADGGAPNVLAAVLGPQMIGEPLINTVERRAGDFLLMGTDGIWDFVPESFSKQFMREAVVRGGRVGETLDAALELLAGHQDDLGHVCTDNLTLAVVAPDRSAPRFGPRFWAATPPTSPSVNEAVGAQEEALPC